MSTRLTLVILKAIRAGKRLETNGTLIVLFDWRLFCNSTFAFGLVWYGIYTASGDELTKIHEVTRVYSLVDILFRFVAFAFTETTDASSSLSDSSESSSNLYFFRAALRPVGCVSSFGLSSARVVLHTPFSITQAANEIIHEVSEGKKIEGSRV